MLETILTTKLNLPLPLSGGVVRPRLLNRLSEGLSRRMTLVSAPAGFGKTTLVSEWGHTCERPVAWLSLDETDSDPTRFLGYLIAAVQTVHPWLGAASMSALQAPQQPPLDQILTGLLNEIAALDDPILLVLDDYHVIDSRAVDDALRFFIEHLPPQLHLVVATREDPNLPLARLRARGQLSELRAADLRFTADEAARFLNEVMGLNLSAADIQALDTRTEGWIAGMQLAALSMQGHDDVSNFIRSFAGSHRFVLDYLFEEVLHRQPEHIRSFLLATSILNRLSASLCDAVTGQTSSRAILEMLERENLFLIPLDDNRQWFRYHHLFADALHARAQQEQPQEITTRHQRASEWYEHHGFRDDAIRHAIAAEDVARAADLIEQVARAMLISRQETTLLGWIGTLPDEVIRDRPVLCTYLALAIVSFDLDAAEVRLQDAEHALDRFSEGVELPVSDKESLPSLRGIIEITRAYHAGAKGDTDGLIAHALKAVEVLPEDDHLWRGAVLALLGLAYWHRGELDAAHRSFADSERALRMIGDITQSISAVLIRSNIAVVQGRLRMAEKICLDVIEQVTRYSQSPSPPIADLHVGVSEIKREHNDLSAAADHLATSEVLGERSGIAEYRHRWFIADARLREARGDLSGTLESLDEAQRQYLPSPDPDVRPFAAMKARIWIKQGQIGEALRWAQERGLTIHDDLTYLQEYEHITLARLLIAQHRNEKRDESIRDAEALLERLAHAAEAGGRYGSLIEILVLRAMATESQGNVADALRHLERALQLAEPEGYVRVFIDEGAPIGRLLEVATSEGIMPDYAQIVLTPLEGSSPEPAVSTSSPLIEPLTAREREILQLIAQGLSNRQICDRLFLSLNTVKGHNRIIFSKLQVQRRTEAVARARELGLI